MVGDGAVGKTCLLITHTTGKFPDEYFSGNAWDHYDATVTVSYRKYIDVLSVSSLLQVDGKPINLTLWDTPMWDYTGINRIMYPKTVRTLLCKEFA